MGRAAVLPALPCALGWLVGLRAPSSGGPRGPPRFLPEGIRRGKVCHWMLWSPGCRRVAIHEKEFEEMQLADEFFFQEPPRLQATWKSGVGNLSLQTLSAAPGSNASGACAECSASHTVTVASLEGRPRFPKGLDAWSSCRPLLRPSA